MKVVRFCVLVLVLLALWQGIVWLTGVPKYILPGPWLVLKAIFTHWPSLARHFWITLSEIALGLFFGALAGGLFAFAMMFSSFLRRWLMPLLVISQAVPVFALAPVLVLWLGYGLASKVVMAVLIIFFPVSAAFFDGLRRTNPDYLELARVMGASPLSVLFRVRLPAAFPGLASGLRVAAAVAPIGAVIGEWVGSSEGLGFYMLHTNARMQIDTMFAALTLLAIIALGLYFSVDSLLRRLVFWKSA